MNRKQALSVFNLYPNTVGMRPTTDLFSALYQHGILRGKYNVAISNSNPHCLIWDDVVVYHATCVETRISSQMGQFGSEIVTVSTNIRVPILLKDILSPFVFLLLSKL